MNKPILVLFSFKSHRFGYIEKLFATLEQRAQSHSLTLKRGALKELHIVIKNNTLSVFDPINQMNLNEFGLVYFELWYKSPQQALAAALYCDRNNIPYFSEELKNMIPLTKVGEIAKLADNSVPIVDTFTSSNRQIKQVFSSDDRPFDFPFILKDAEGYGGNNNFLVKDFNQLRKLLSDYKSVTFIAQKFIPNNCDYRCLVLGNEVVLVLKRSRIGNDTHLNNTSQGADGEIVPVGSLPQKALRDAVNAAQVLGRGSFAGVDLIIDSQTGEHYILEVNQTPQIEIGADVDSKMDALLSYIRKRAI
ncbi:ATP-grasp domain-containing protein [Candidatus Saccharibacteria bacterium]|nr:ATP-grasp domain-containing protein [Candidatus Saccharibacteria bacterium]